MNKNDLLEAFSNVCGYLADNLQSELLPFLHDETETIRPFYEDANVTDLNKWWHWNNHLAGYVLQIEEMAAEDPNSRRENFQEGMRELVEDTDLRPAFDAILEDAEDRGIAALQHLPHLADYASEFKDTIGFKRLASVCARMDDVMVMPAMTLKPEATDLQKAFYLNVMIGTTDGSPLKPKIERLPRLVS